MAKDLKANQNQRRSAVCALFLAISAALGACRHASTPGTDVSAQILNNTYYESYDREPYAVRTELKEYTALNEKTGKGAYGRFTELKVEGNAPDTFRSAVAECNRRAEESVRTRVDRIAEEAGGFSLAKKEYTYVTYGYIACVTRADGVAFSILETEFEKSGDDSRNHSDLSYRFRGLAYDTASGAEIPLSDLVPDEATCSKMLRDALKSKYGTDGLASADLADCAWTADVLGIRFYVNSDAISKEKRREIGDYSSRAVTAALPYDSLPGAKAKSLSEAPDSYIAMIDRETVYDLPHGKQSVQLTVKDGETYISIAENSGETSELRIEYGDSQSDYYIIRASDGFYLFRERIGYQEGFFYDFAKPDGGFGRFAYNTSQYFDSFLREIELALPYNPYCTHMAEVRRSFGEKSYDSCAFVPNGHYTFPSDPNARYKKFVLTDRSLRTDTYNVACRLLEDFDAVRIDEKGNDIGKITVSAGKNLFFEAVIGEASRYDVPPHRSEYRSSQYECRLKDGTRIRFESSTDSVVSTNKGYLTRFSEQITLAAALYEAEPETVPAAKLFSVRIGKKDYPLIPDYSKINHAGEQIDFGKDLWWQVEDYVGRYVITNEDLEEMRDGYDTWDALEHAGEKAELVISENGEVEFDYFGEIFKGKLPEKRYYQEYVSVRVESDRENRTFTIIPRDFEPHETPNRINFYSEGLPATNEPSHVPPLSVYMTRVSK